MPVSPHSVKRLTSLTIGLVISTCFLASANATPANTTTYIQESPASQVAPCRMGSVSLTVAPNSPLEQTLSMLMESDQKSDDEKKVQKAVDRFSKKNAYLKARASDAINSVFMFKGVSTSSEAGDVILDEKLKLKSVGAARYAQQQFKDEKELKVLAALLQISAGLGAADPTDAAQQIESAKRQLAEVSGPDAAEKAVAMLKASSFDSSISDDTNAPARWSVSEMQHRVRETVRSAALRDPIVDEIKADVHHYNQHSQLTMAAHRIIRVTLSVSSLAPNVVGPVSQGILFGYVVLSGGSEQSKILKELYMEKRLTERANLITEEAHLAMHNYQMAKLTQNKPLASCSAMLMVRLTGLETAQALLSGADSTNFNSSTAMVSSSGQTN